MEITVNAVCTRGGVKKLSLLKAEMVPNGNGNSSALRHNTAWHSQYCILYPLHR